MPEKIPRKPHKSRGPAGPTLTTAIRQALKAGATITSATIERGKVTLIFSEPVKESRNPWDEVLNDDQKN